MATKTTTNTQKKRGRPPKTDIKPKPIILQQNKETEELVLYLPITDKQNDFTTNGLDTEISHDVITTQKESFDDISDDIDEIENSTNVNNTNNTNNDNINKLIDEIKKRDIIIKNLKDNLKNFKVNQQDNILSVNKNIKKTLINLGLITLNDNKLITATTSKLACWWCCYNFDSYPVFLPEKYVNNKYHVFGNFCSFSCVLAYNNNLNDYRKNIREGLIRKIYKDIFNTECEIKPSASREVLEKFGGPISIDNYRDPKSICTKNYSINIPPQIPLLSYFEEINIGKT